MRTGASLGVVLNRIHRKAAVFQALDSVVVQIKVGNFAIGWKRIGVDGETMILCGYFNPAGREIFDGLIAAVMTKRQLIGASAQGQPE